MNPRSTISPPTGTIRISAALVVFAAANILAWSAEGTVKDGKGAVVADVEVGVKDSAAYRTTTGATGAFRIGSPTGISADRTNRLGAWREGNELVVASPAGVMVQMSLVDASGASVWSASALSSQGQARASLPSLGRGALFLRVRMGTTVIHQAVQLGAEGLDVSPPSVAGRAAATGRTLQFRKTGYRDTSYTMAADVASGLAIVLQKSEAIIACPSPALKAGDQNRTITVKGVSRKYILHVPAGYTGTTSVPLLVDFHPIGGSASGQSSGTQYKSLADKDGAISVYPDGLTGPMGQAWNVKGCCTTADDTAFARALVAEVKQVACIDPKRVYAAGFSMGGGMTHFSACHLSDIFAAAAPAAFDLLKENVDICKPVRPITMIMFRGTNDNVVSYAGGYSSVVSGMPINFLGAKATFEKWAALNTCTGSPSATDANGCSTYSNCAGGVQVTLCTKQGGGHDQGNGAVGWPLLKKYTLP